MPLDVLVEGLLFYKSTPLKRSFIAKLFAVSPVDVDAALAILRTRLETSGIRLLETDTEVQLVTAPELGPVIDTIRKNEMRKDIGKAGAETLAIILYQEPISRAEIDRIRGVNSSVILRNLLIRGLIERNQNQSGGGYTFSVSPALLAHLGITTKQQLTDYAHVMNELEHFGATDVTENT